VLTTPPCKNECSETLTGGMIPLETKQSGGKLLPHSDIWGVGGGSVSRGNIAQHTKKHENSTGNVRSFYRTGSLKAAARELTRSPGGGMCVYGLDWAGPG